MEKEKIRRLVLQAGQGDRAAFGELYEETGRSVYFKLPEASWKCSAGGGYNSGHFHESS